MKYSIVVPIYKNEVTIPRLLQTLATMNKGLGNELEAVFVVDGSPDQSLALLRGALDKLGFPAQILAHSRNFGSFPAIRTGLQAARGEYFAVMAADLQEPPELVVSFFAALVANECDVAIGARGRRDDPFLSKIASRLFWGLYRRMVVPEMPEGGVDVFGCNQNFRKQLLKLEESRSSLIALIFWLGFSRKLFAYDRLPRQDGKSAWTFSKKIEYMTDSVFAFTDFPVKLLTRMGAIGLALSIGLGLAILVARLAGAITVPGYTATLLVILVLGALNLLGLGVVGSYAWRGYENSKRRPSAIVAVRHVNKLEN